MRSAYVTDMQFDQAGVIVRPIRWYVAPPKARIFRVAPAFHSSNYGDQGGGDLGVGEVWYASKTWSNGATPKWATGEGVFCGPLAWWQNGCPSDAPPLQFIGDNPVCCGTPGRPAAIGFQVGLKSCISCPEFPTPPVYLTYGTFCTNLQGVWDGLTQIQWWILPGQFLVQMFVQNNPCHSGSPPYCMSVVSNFFGHSDGLSYAGKLPGVDFSALFIGSGLPQPGGDAPYVFTWFNQVVTSDVGFDLGLVAFRYKSRHPGALGLKFGLVANAVHSSGQLGAQFGLSAGEMGSELGRVGFKPGLESEELAGLTGQLGMKSGLGGTLKARVSGAEGQKAGLAAALKATGLGAIGGKFGLASTTRTGIIVQCCPGLVIPLTLTVTRSSHTATATYVAADNGWHWIDPLLPINFTLQCNLIGSTWTFQTPTATIHCVGVSTQTAKTCSHPFSVTVSVVVSSSGGTCLEAGTYVNVISE